MDLLLSAAGVIIFSPVNKFCVGVPSTNRISEIFVAFRVPFSADTVFKIFPEVIIKLLLST